MYAFVLNHFGKDLIYLKYELYFLFSLKENTKYDIIYIYSLNDTPDFFINIIKSLNLNIITIPYNDKDITYDVEFKSSYKSFNLLRTCNYIFAFEFLKYKKICILESDMIITSNIDDIFKLKTPSIVYYPLNKYNINTNIKIKLEEERLKEIIKDCPKESFTNGGVILFKPSLNIFKKLKENIKKIVNYNCIYPNETLFLYTFHTFYNLPIMYNMSHWELKKHNYNFPIKILHFNNYAYKPIDIIEDINFNINKMKNQIIKKILLDFKKRYYNKYNKKIKKINL
jgi:hypothetical protein